MSLPKKKRSQSKKSRGGGASSKKPLIPKGHKYLGKAGNYHYTESTTGTVYRGLGDSESSYRMEAMDKSVWKPPAGLSKKKAKAPKPKKAVKAKEREQRALEARASLIAEKERKSAKASKAQLDATARKEKLAQDFQKKIDAASTHDEIDRIVRKAKKETYLSKAMRVDIENYGISAGRDLYGTPRYEKQRKKELAKREKERAAAQKRVEFNLAKQERQDKLAEGYKKKLDAAESSSDIFNIQLKAGHDEDINKSTLVQIKVYARNAEHNLQSVHSKRNIEAAEQKATAVRVEKAEAFKKKIRDAVTKEQVDSVVGEALGFAKYNPAFSRVHLDDIKGQADFQNKAIARADTVISRATGKPTSTTKELRQQDTRIETTKGFIKELRPKDEYNAIKDAKTLGEIEEALKKLNKHWDEDKSLLKNSATLLDASKAAGVAPSHSTQFQLGTGIFKDYQEVHGLSYDTFPMLPSFIESEYTGHVDFVDDKGKKVATYSSDYVFPVLKATKSSDMLWFNKTDRPLIGVNQRTREKIVLAPRVERRSGSPAETESKAKMEELRRRGLILNHKGGVKAGHKVVFTRRHQYIELPDGRAVELSAHKANPFKDFDAAQEKGVWSVPLLDKLTSKQMYQYAFLTASTGRRGIGHMEFETRELKNNPTEKVKNDRGTAELAVQGFFEHEKKVTLKGKTGLITKDYTTTIDGKKIQYSTKDIQAARAIFGKDVTFYFVKLPKNSGYSKNTIVADSPDGLAQIRIAGTTAQKYR